MRILLVEDDELLAESLAELLDDAGYRTDISPSSRSASALSASEEYTLVILDLGLPDGSGLSLLSDWRDAKWSVPILILTARDSWMDKVEGLRAGADDYLTKPYHEEELLARLEALLRRRGSHFSSLLEINNLRLDEARQQFSVDHQEWQTLTSTEFRLLRYLMRHPDRVHSKRHLLEQLYALEQDAAAPNLVEVYIGRLRHRLGRERIVTRRGEGYMLVSV
ncbi:response regulator transcription factor [Salinicola sp. LHM]|uniref:response regulator n=1 Tax=Halomonadaceae TaxID=28256 RepID=UPI002072F40D|nr:MULTISPECIES: response regulator transcription factor [Halomonadaceae]MCM5705812.1 response regulator transcription factor [Larsenimonas salina]WQH33568.1 response regulator transcription factor [Salinicola sp. LHM]|tara:strand:+ start:234 stop:899 length:666 start_codon:yes stop_codon:yes gene_type:complete